MPNIGLQSDCHQKKCPLNDKGQDSCRIRVSHTIVARYRFMTALMIAIGANFTLIDFREYKSVLKKNVILLWV